MTTDNFCFYSQNRLIQASQTGGQWYSDTFPFSIPWQHQKMSFEMFLIFSKLFFSSLIRISIASQPQQRKMREFCFFNKLTKFSEVLCSRECFETSNWETWKSNTKGMLVGVSTHFCCLNSSSIIRCKNWCCIGVYFIPFFLLGLCGLILIGDF